MPEFKLWWPNGYEEQNLYTLELSFKSDSGEVTYSKTSFGIRELVLDPFPTGETESMYNRTVVINGRKLFMKSAGWCTIDALMRFTREDYDRILRRAKEQGLNFLRAWGGGMPETDDFMICVMNMELPFIRNGPAAGTVMIHSLPMCFMRPLY